MKQVLYDPTDVERRDSLIKDILARGNIVRFTNRFNGITKDVKEWNPDADGDLTAFRTEGGQTLFVCPYALEYEISEVPLD